MPPIQARFIPATVSQLLFSRTSRTSTLAPRASYCYCVRHFHARSLPPPPSGAITPQNFPFRGRLILPGCFRHLVAIRFRPLYRLILKFLCAACSIQADNFSHIRAHFSCSKLFFVADLKIFVLLYFIKCALML